MSLARTTVGIGRWLDSLAAGSTSRRGVIVGLLTLSALLVVACTAVLLLSPEARLPVMTLGGSAIALFTISMMLTRPEWLLLLGLLAGHTLLYGKYPNQFGMRFKNAFGPGDILFFLSFVSMITYWANQKMRPPVPKALWIAPVALFLYTAIYTYIAYAYWDRQDNALIQAVGWFYFTLAIPTYLCLATGRIWNSFFAVIFVALFLGAILAFCVEVGAFYQIIERFGYGGRSPRSFGDLSVRTNQLGLAVTGTLVAMVICGFARRGFWKYASLIGGLGGAAIIFLDRGRASYAGMLVAALIVLFMMPMTTRLRLALRTTTTVVAAILIILAIGGPAADKFSDTAEKAANAVALINADAITADQGLTYRMKLLTRAGTIFAQNPWFGGGPGVHFGRRVNYQLLETEFIIFIDNSWMYPMAVGGLVAISLIVLSYVSLVVLVILALTRLRHPLHRALAAVPLGQMAWLLVCSPVNWWMVDRFHIASFALGAGMVLALAYYEKVNGSERAVIAIGEEE
ncbi:MAG: O-antigen ligase family protein [Armatimonadota bacterium]|nr:O-antigen ligase family protein [Armatimonadota bacterium]